MKELTFEYPNWVYRVDSVKKVVDGDTIDVRLDVGFDTLITKRLRFLDIDTWEVRGEEKEMGKVAKARLIELLTAAPEIYVQTVMDATGKYGRVLAWVWLVDKVNETQLIANRVLLEEGHGTPEV